MSPAARGKNVMAVNASTNDKIVKQPDVQTALYVEAVDAIL
jgi:hypothetical protein